MYLFPQRSKDLRSASGSTKRHGIWFRVTLHVLTFSWDMWIHPDSHLWSLCGPCQQHVQQLLLQQFLRAAWCLCSHRSLLQFRLTFSSLCWLLFAAVSPAVIRHWTPGTSPVVLGSWPAICCFCRHAKHLSLTPCRNHQRAPTWKTGPTHGRWRKQGKTKIGK